MKHAVTSVLVIFLAVVMTTVVKAQSEEQESPYAQCFGIVGTSDYYFGEIGQTETVEHEFVFKNNCDQTVEIGSVRASCGCTAAVLSDHTVPPGGEAKIQVKFTPPRGSRGKVTKTVSLYMKDEQKPHTIIRFSAKIQTNLDIQPQYIQLLGAEVGKAITGAATIKNTSDKPITVDGISINITSYADTSGNGQSVAMPLDGATVTPARLELAPGQSGDVTVTLVPRHKGQVNGAVRIAAGSDEGIIQVFGVVRDGVEASFRKAGSESGKVMLDGSK